MKKRLLKTGASIIAGVFVFCACSLSLLSYSEGSDPIVTLSYLTEIILPQLKKDIISEVIVQTGNDAFLDNTQLPDMTPDINTDITGPDNSQNETSSEDNPSDETETNQTATKTGTYELLELENGQCVYTNSVLEFIVRPGSVVEVISPFEAQGIADITKGIEYLNGDSVNINTYCLIPRGSDGRGIKVSNEKSYILVRGEYYIG